MARPMIGVPLREAYQALGNRGPGFDMLRLVAATAVVVHHSMVIEHDIVRDDWLFRFSGSYTHLGLLAVSIFFALSGYLITPGLVKSGNVIGYFSRRFMRVMPLLVVVVVSTAFVIGPFFSSLPPSEYYASAETWRYLKTITTFLSLQLPGVVSYDGSDTINDPIWSLHYEWMCYIGLGLLALTGAMSRRWIFLAVYIAAMFALVFVLGDIPADEKRGRLFTFLFLFGYFGAGVLVYLYGDILRWSRGIMAAVLLVLVFVWATPLNYVFAPLLTAFLVVGTGLFKFPETPLTTGVDLSYGVYLSHAVVLMALVNLFPFQSWIALFAVAWSLSLAIAYATWTFIEAPALAYKDWPEKLVRTALSRSLARIKPEKS